MIEYCNCRPEPTRRELVENDWKCLRCGNPVMCGVCRNRPASELYVSIPVCGDNKCQDSACAFYENFWT